MMVTPPTALACAAFAACSYALGSVLQSVGARRTAGLAGTFGQPAYAAGLAADLVAWLASLVALRAMPVFLVQSVLAGSVAVTVLLARVMLHVRLRRVDVGAVAVTVCALAVLAASSSAGPSADLSTAGRWALALALVPLALVGLLSVRRRSAGGAAVAAGLAFGGTALCARALTLPASIRHGLGGAVHTLGTDPVAWSLVGFSVAGLLLYAFALEHGDVGPVTAILWIVEVLVPSAVGILVLGDAVRTGWLPAAGVGMLAAVGSAVVLAGAPAQVATAPTADPSAPSTG